MRKKRVVLTAIVVLVLVVFSACGGSEKQEDNKSGENAGKAWALPDYAGGNEGLADFKTLDLSGKETDSGIFSGHKYTLVDVWGTYCNPCIRSMPDNEMLYQDYKDKGLGVVGIVVDAVDNSGNVSMDQVDYAKELIGQQKVTYPVLLPSASVMKNLAESISVIPSYFFVDSKGNITSTIYEGGRSYDEWTKIIREETGIK